MPPSHASHMQTERKGDRKVDSEVPIKVTVHLCFSTGDGGECWVKVGSGGRTGHGRIHAVFVPHGGNVGNRCWETPGEQKKKKKKKRERVWAMHVEEVCGQRLSIGNHAADTW